MKLFNKNLLNIMCYNVSFWLLTTLGKMNIIPNHHGE